MAINKKLIHFSKGENFDTQKENNNILDSSICFIQDRKTIVTHGTEYKAIGWSLLPVPIKSEGKANGVYAITAKGELIAYNDSNIDATCLGVALITDNQRIMIEKNETANAEWNSNTTLYWGKNLYYKDVAGITETTGQAVAKADFSGKEHTNAIIAAYTEHSVAMDTRDMCSVLQTFNDGENNGGFTDWYIPAEGQLYEIYTNKTNINAALTAMSSTAFSDYGYWSSSEYNSRYGWSVHFGNGGVLSSYKDDYGRVRFVRDI